MTTGLNWGASAAERATPTPADALVPSTATRADRAINISAPPAVVFGWLCQLRRAPYSYDLLDNFGRHSPRQLDPELVRLEVGQEFMRIFALVSFTDGAQITLRTSSVAVTYTVAARGDGDRGSRLHVRVCFAQPPLVAQTLALGDLVMMRKQLHTLKALAERDAAREHR